MAFEKNVANGEEQKNNQVEQGRKDVKKRGSLIEDMSNLTEINVNAQGKGPSTPPKAASKEIPLDFEEQIIVPGKEEEKKG